MVAKKFLRKESNQKIGSKSQIQETWKGKPFKVNGNPIFFPKILPWPFLGRRTFNQRIPNLKPMNQLFPVLIRIRFLKWGSFLTNSS